MHRSTLLSYVVLLSPALCVAAAAGATAGGLSAAQIVEKNIAARGGLAAWHNLKSMTWTGQLEAGGNNRPTLAIPSEARKVSLPAARPQQQMELPFRMELERSRKSRLEIQFGGQTALQVYDGTQGWKVRPFLNRHQVESDIDGPLVDYANKWSTISLDGREAVEGRDCYKLTVTSRDKHVQHIWIDSKSFLEAKEEGQPRRLDGRYHPVAVYLRDYTSVSGLTLPTMFETVVEGAKSTETIHVEKILVNASIPDSHFGKPQ
jgi:hypothetical protein